MSPELLAALTELAAVERAWRERMAAAFARYPIEARGNVSIWHCISEEERDALRVLGRQRTRIQDTIADIALVMATEVAA